MKTALFDFGDHLGGVYTCFIRFELITSFIYMFHSFQIIAYSQTVPFSLPSCCNWIYTSFINALALHIKK